MRPLPLLSAVLLSTACSGSPVPVDESWVDEIPQDWVDVGFSTHHGGATLVVDTEVRDAVTAYADCGFLLKQCLDDTQGDFDGCVDDVQRCGTEAPWEEGPCCPTACRDQYRELRKGDSNTPFDAYVTVFVQDTSCVPGLASRSER